MFWSSRTNRPGLPEKFFNLIFNVIFYFALCNSLCISHVPVVVCIKHVPTNFIKCTENTEVSDFRFNYAAEIQPTILLKKKLQYRCFPVNLAKFLRTSTLQNTSG